MESSKKPQISVKYKGVSIDRLMALRRELGLQMDRHFRLNDENAPVDEEFWEALNESVDLEVAVRVRDGSERIDYILRLEDLRESLEQSESYRKAEEVSREVTYFLHSFI